MNKTDEYFRELDRQYGAAEDLRMQRGEVPRCRRCQCGMILGRGYFDKETRKTVSEYFAKPTCPNCGGVELLAEADFWEQWEERELAREDDRMRQLDAEAQKGIEL